MRWYRLFVAGAVVSGAMSLLPAAPALATGTPADSVYSFVLAPPNTAVSPTGGTMSTAGDWIRVQGAGIFDPARHTVAAGGWFVHYSSTGAVLCKGMWKATRFTSFTAFGGTRRDEGGVLSIVVTHYCKTMGMTMTGISMTVTSTEDAPPGGYTEGTTVADFTQPTGGAVRIESVH